MTEVYGSAVEDIPTGEVDIPDDDQEKKALLTKIEGDGDDDVQPFQFRWKKFWAFTGPGWLMSIAYLDPGNLESDLQAGAVAGYKLLWILFWATCVGWVLQMLAARLGVVTGLLCLIHNIIELGKNLAEHCRDTFPTIPRYILWIMTEIAIIGADIQEVVGSAIALNILTSNYIPLWGGVLITAIDTFAFLFLEQGGIRKLEAFFCILISVMAITFGIEYVMSKPNQLEVLKGVIIPNTPKNSVVQAVGILGAVIMPHNIYLHSALVQSRKIDRTKVSKIHEANIYNAIESAVALFVTFIVNMFVVSVFAASFYPIRDVNSIGLVNAANKLEVLYGPSAKYVWAIGLLAAGQSSTMTGTYAGQFVMQGFLNLQIKPWARVAVTRSIAIIPSVAVALLASSNGLDMLDEWINVLQSVQLPFAVIPVLILTQNPDVMKSFTNHLGVTILCWELAVVVIGTNLYLIYQFTVSTFANVSWWVWFIYGVVGFFYFLFIFYIIVTPRRFQRWARRNGFKRGCCPGCELPEEDGEPINE